MADYTNFLASIGFGNPDDDLNLQSPQAPGVPDQPQASAPPQLPVQNSVVPGILAQLQQQNGGAPAPIDPAAQQPPVNAMQAADPTQQASVAPPAQAAPVQAPVAAPKQRWSLVDIIGHVSDALAQAGGATPMYQRTLDDNAARQLAKEDHARAVVSNTLQNAHTQQEIDASKALTGKTDAETQSSLNTLAATRYGSALRGLQAIIKANPNADVGTIWPILAKQQGIDDSGAQHLLSVIQANPGSIDGLAAEYEKQKTGSSGGELGLNPFLATDGAGHTKAYQLSKSGELHEITLPAGFQAASSTSTVDSGDMVHVIDKRSGRQIGSFVKAGGPEKGETPITDAHGKVVAYSDVPGSKIDTANKKDLPASGAAFTAYSKARKGLENLANGLDDIANDPGLGHATATSGMITSHLPSGLGGGDTQKILQKIETLKGRAIPAALNTMRDVNGKLGFRPSQTEVLGDAKGLLGALDNRKVSTGDYINSLKANKQLIIEQIKALDEDAQRNGYVVSQGGKLVPAPKKSAAPADLPPRVVLKPNARGGAPTVSNW